MPSSLLPNTAYTGQSADGKTAESPRFRSIKSKLTLILMATSSFAVLMACILFYYLVVQHFQKNYIKDLTTLNDIIGYNCQAALTFNVPEDAVRILSSVRGRKSIVAIRLYSSRGRLFAEYNNRNLSSLPLAARNKILTGKGILRVSRKIILDDGSAIGTIDIYDNQRDIESSKKKGLYIFAITVIFSLMFAFCLATFLQNIIYTPILTLTKAVQRLATGDFKAGQTISINSQDEIGILSRTFIEMSAKLNESYMKLKSYNQDLAAQVETRTHDLQQALTDLTKSQQQLVQSEKLAAIGYMMAGIAHEINNSLNFTAGAIPVVIELTGKLKKDCGSGESSRGKANSTINKIETLLTNAMEGVSRTTSLMRDLNSFSRPSNGHFTAVNIHREIDTVLLLLRYELKDRVKIIRDYAANLPAVKCLKDQMNQVYMNILLNASQAIATGAQGSIWIRTWADATDHGLVHIRIRDNGCGIPEQVKNKIFDPFFTTKKVGKGTGLGLSIAYGIVKSHHGEIKVTNSPEGTTFTISLPVQPQDNRINAEEAAA